MRWPTRSSMTRRYILNDIPKYHEGGASVRFEIEMFRPVVMKGRLEMIK